jgi:hypothetical protein
MGLARIHQDDIERAVAERRREPRDKLQPAGAAADHNDLGFLFRGLLGIYGVEP